MIAAGSSTCAHLLPSDINKAISYKAKAKAMSQNRATAPCDLVFFRGWATDSAPTHTSHQLDLLILPGVAFVRTVGKL